MTFMNKLKLVVVALILTACGAQESNKIETSIQTEKDPALALRDSAMQLVYGQSGEIDYTESLRLLDEAIALDPGNRSIFYSKMQVLSKSGSEEDIFNMQVSLDTLDFKDGYTTLQLGVEYELRGDIDKADAKYHEAIGIFSAILDTMQNTPLVSRNNNILNLAVAETLVQNGQDKLQTVMTDEEKQHLSEIIDQIKNSKRADLLQMNRKKTR